MWLASELMFFAGLFAAYFSLRSINDTWPPDDVELAILAARIEGTELNPGQEQLVRAMATSGRQVQLALAPAGAGKTTAMRVLAGVWIEAGSDVVGLAPAAAAARAIADSLAELAGRELGL